MRRNYFLAFLIWISCNPALSQSEKSQVVRAKTLFQTNCGYDPRIALAVDAVIVHQHGNDPTRLIRSWQGQGFSVGRMFFADSDAGNIYWTGKWDGKEHPGDMERRQDGQVVQCANVRPYMLPTEGWIRYLEEMTVRSLDAGATAILPEEPLAHVFTGYEESFKDLWRQRYDLPWRGQHEDAEARWLTAQLKNELYITLEKRLAVKTRQYALEHDKKLGFILPIHSIYSNIAAQLVAPLGTSVNLEGVDGYIGQIWTGPVNWALAHYDAPDKSFFTSAYALYDYFTQLTVESDKKLWLLVDPVEDNPDHTWAEFTEWYKHCVAAMLLMEDVDSYEIMPWPDRIFLPGYQTGGSTPAPEDYRTMILSVTQALQEVPMGGSSDSGLMSLRGIEGIGIAVSDTFMWQRHDGPWLQGMYGMLLPLIGQGIPVSSCILERSADRRYMSRFKVIVLSYKDFKPLDAAWNEAIAEWIKRGGKLVLLQSEPDELDRCANMWWKKAGIASAQEHLLSLISSPQGQKEDWELGKGQVTRWDISPRDIALSEEIRKKYMTLLGHAMESDDEISGPLYGPGCFALLCGPFLVAHAESRSYAKDGLWIDLFDPSLKVIHKIGLKPGQSGLYKDIAALVHGKEPVVLHTTHRLMEQEFANGRLRFLIRGPAETPAVVRVFFPGKEPPKISTRSADGNGVDVDITSDSDSNTFLLKFPNHTQGVTVEIHH
ncbi:MAG: hypothetical protein JW828_00115 [Sedimentisphaerales bacterium]|nr:hypothetical protein [Sedimentisphaerales bacterium]